MQLIYKIWSFIKTLFSKTRKPTEKQPFTKLSDIYRNHLSMVRLQAQLRKQKPKKNRKRGKQAKSMRQYKKAHSLFTSPRGY